MLDILLPMINVDGLTPLMTWLENSGLHDWVVGSAWIWPTLESFHFLGLCLLIGGLIFVDMRVLGFAGKAPLKEMHAFVPIVVIGFLINLITGTLFVFGDPFRYFPNIAFQLKMFLIFLAGLNVLYFETKVHPKIKAGETQVGFDGKLVAALSLIFWIIVVIAGRMIPYVEY